MQNIKHLIIRKLGGYASVDEALLDAPQKTLNAAVSKSFCFIKSSDLFRFDKRTGTYYAGKNELSIEEVKRLTSEAEMISKLELWKYLLMDLEYQASKRIYFDSQNVNDLTWGKLLIFTKDMLKTRISELKKIRNKI